MRPAQAQHHLRCRRRTGSWPALNRPQTQPESVFFHCILQSNFDQRGNMPCGAPWLAGLVLAAAVGLAAAGRSLQQVRRVTEKPAPAPVGSTKALAGLRPAASEPAAPPPPLAPCAQGTEASTSSDQQYVANPYMFNISAVPASPQSDEYGSVQSPSDDAVPALAAAGMAVRGPAARAAWWRGRGERSRWLWLDAHRPAWADWRPRPGVAHSAPSRRPPPAAGASAGAGDPRGPAALRGLPARPAPRHERGGGAERGCALAGGGGRALLGRLARAKCSQARGRCAASLPLRCAVQPPWPPTALSGTCCRGCCRQHALHPH